MTHPHAEILRAIADGVPLSEFEITWGIKSSWESLEDYVELFFRESSEVRRKQQTHVVNGFTVPAPLDKMPPPESMYFYPIIGRKEFTHYAHWATHAFGDEYDRMMFSSGLCFATREAAVANAKAMLKINPEAA